LQTLDTPHPVEIYFPSILPLTFVFGEEGLRTSYSNNSKKQRKSIWSSGSDNCHLKHPWT